MSSDDNEELLYLRKLIKYGKKRSIHLGTCINCDEECAWGCLFLCGEEQPYEDYDDRCYTNKLVCDLNCTKTFEHWVCGRRACLKETKPQLVTLRQD